MEKLNIDYKFATNSEALSFVAQVSKNLAKGKEIKVEEAPVKEEEPEELELLVDKVGGALTNLEKAIGDLRQAIVGQKLPF